ncbi:hypothetical protein D9758_017090 [Tetrapyrgos nigripes]|uniref:Uncharacterized protein n=1 Tax=Tetrapyrgos nigripes TaxID=182062 RepID=A0A8H5C3U9_9AGAR|nr:hypothetical protein D9758_017090 [Tetrapyrgos nigripes]
MLDAAKNQVTMNPHNMVFNTKRPIGCKSDEGRHQALPFQGHNKGGRPYIGVKAKNLSVYHCSPEEISTMVLLKMKETVNSSYLGTTVTNTVVTLPAYVNDSQQQATKDDFWPQRPLYHQRAHCCRHRIWSQQGLEQAQLEVLLMSLLTILKRVLKLRLPLETPTWAVKTLTTFVNHIVEEFKRKNKKDLSTNAHALRYLRTACECAKHTLPLLPKSPLKSTLFSRTFIDFYTSLICACFKELCQVLFHSTLKLVKKVLCGFNIDKANVHDIVLVRWSTHIPRIVKLISGFFNSQEPNKSNNPNEAAAYRAAVQAAILSGDTSKRLRTCRISFIRTTGGVMTPLTKPNTMTLTQKSEIFSTYANNHSATTIHVYEGECACTKDNNLIEPYKPITFNYLARQPIGHEVSVLQLPGQTTPPPPHVMPSASYSDHQGSSASQPFSIAFDSALNSLGNVHKYRPSPSPTPTQNDSDHPSHSPSDYEQSHQRQNGWSLLSSNELQSALAARGLKPSSSSEGNDGASSVNNGEYFRHDGQALADAGDVHHEGSVDRSLRLLRNGSVTDSGSEADDENDDDRAESLGEPMAVDADSFWFHVNGRITLEGTVTWWLHHCSYGPDGHWKENKKKQLCRQLLQLWLRPGQYSVFNPTLFSAKFKQQMATTGTLQVEAWYIWASQHSAHIYTLNMSGFAFFIIFGFAEEAMKNYDHHTFWFLAKPLIYLSLLSSFKPKIHKPINNAGLHLAIGLNTFMEKHKDFVVPTTISMIVLGNPEVDVEDEQGSECGSNVDVDLEKGQHRHGV